MNRKRFARIEEIKEKSKQKLLKIPKSAFQKCFEDWKKCWHKYIISEGGYFEEEKIVYFIYLLITIQLQIIF